MQRYRTARLFSPSGMLGSDRGEFSVYACIPVYTDWDVRTDNNEDSDKTINTILRTSSQYAD